MIKTIQHCVWGEAFRRMYKNVGWLDDDDQAAPANREFANRWDSPASSKYYRVVDRLSSEGLRIGGALGTLCNCPTDLCEGIRICEPEAQVGRYCPLWDRVL